VASDVASCVLHKPPAPLNVGRPEEADSPAPKRARIRVDSARCCWKLSRSFGGTTLGLAAVVAILRMRVGRITVTRAAVFFFADCVCEERDSLVVVLVSCMRCLSDTSGGRDGGLEVVAGEAARYDVSSVPH
jgi:hypothetical protein